jgi:hypothetical protein
MAFVLAVALALAPVEASAGEAAASEPTPRAPTTASRAATARGFELDGYDMSISFDKSAASFEVLGFACPPGGAASLVSNEAICESASDL